MGFLELRHQCWVSHEVRRGPQGASHEVPGKLSLHARGPAGREDLTPAPVAGRCPAAEGRVPLPQPMRQYALRQGALHGADAQPPRRPLPGPETQPQRGLHLVSWAGGLGAGRDPSSGLNLPAHPGLGNPATHRSPALGALGKRLNLPKLGSSEKR